MAKRYIGIDLDGETARVALLTVEGTQVALELHKRHYTSPEDARSVLDELTGGTRPLGDHLVTALPAGAGFVRSLTFPFKERSKLMAVLGAELEGQVPVSLAQHTCAMQSPREENGTYRVTAAAVRSDLIEQVLEHFPDPAQQPRRIDLLPHALVGGLGEPDGLLVYCGRQETVVALVLDSRVAEFRLLPADVDLSEEEISRFVLTQLAQLERAGGRDNLPLWICGSAVTESLQHSLEGAGAVLSALVLPVDQDVPMEFLPALLLALTEKENNRQAVFNFRTGSYAPRGQLEMLKKKLIAAAALGLLCLLVIAATGYVNYHRKAEQAALLKQQLEAVFRQTMPTAKVVVDVPLQLRSRYQELQQQALLLGVGGQGTALNVLQTLSSLIDVGIKSDLQEMVYSGDQVRLDGYTDSFDSVNRITQGLKTSKLFSKVEISEAKMAADGGRVDFQLQIDLVQAGEGL
ncbi:MAG: type II secretion system protein GspL [Desulfuromonadales bacterium]|nr:type II secretion system protein GspL [Desulfuromonadales bacterium]